MRILLMVLVTSFVFTGCQQKQTKVTSQEAVIGESITAEKLMKQKPVILDVRPSFEFNLAHVPGAINVRWEDFSRPEAKNRGLLQNDLFALARRLSLIGIDPETKVVVLGKGREGNGEEGRVAWTLKVLGVQQVYTLLHTSYRQLNPREIPAPVKNKPYWKPQVDEDLTVHLAEFRAYATGKVDKTNFSPRYGYKPIEAVENLVILDVRSSQEFAQRNLSQFKDVKAKVVSMEWRELFDAANLPSKKAVELLAAKGVLKNNIIFVISNHGVRSGAATYALQYLGFGRVSNFSGGYEQWK